MFVAFGVLVVITLFTALIAPYFIDWTAYKTEFEKQASKILGQQVSVGGNAEIRLLPQPSLNFKDLTVGQNINGKPMVRIGQFSANVELMPFLSGEVRIVSMGLDQADFNIEVDEGGQILWTKRAGLLVNPDHVKLDKLTLTNASFTITDRADGRIIKGQALNAKVSAVSLFGPWKITGEGTVDSRQTYFDITTGRFSDDYSMRLKTRIQQADNPYEILSDGPVTLKDEVLSWDGKFQIQPVAKDKIAALGLKTPQPLPILVDGTYRLSPRALKLPEYRIEIGAKDDPFTLNGKGDINFRDKTRFRLQIDGRQIDLDRVAQMRGHKEGAPTNLESRLQLFSNVLAQIPIPKIDGDIDLEIPAIVAGDTLIRGVSALVHPFGKGWEISRLSAALPGNTKIEADGRLGVGEEFGFHGNILVASKQPSGLAAWIGGEVDPAIRRLSALGLSSGVTLSPDQLSLDGLTLIMDQRKLTGSVQRISGVEGSEGVPAIIANLDGSLIQLEDLRAIGSLILGKDRAGKKHDFDVRIKADRVSGFDLTAAGVDLQLQYKNEELSVARLNLANFLETEIKSAGQISNLLKQPKGNFSLSLKTDNLQSVAALLIDRFEDNPLLRSLKNNAELSKHTNLTFEIDSSPQKPSPSQDGNLSRSRVILSGQLGGSDITSRGTFEGGFGTLEDLWMDISLEAHNKNPNILLQQIGLEEVGFSTLYGGLSDPLKLTLESAGKLSDGYSTIISANNGSTSATGEGLIRRDKVGQIGYEFDVTLGSENISPVISSFGFLLPDLNQLTGDVAPFLLNGTFSKTFEENYKLQIDRSQLNGNNFSGELAYGANGGENKRLKGNLKFDQINAVHLLALAVGSGGLEGGELLSENNFIGPLFKGYTGALKIEAGALDFSDGLHAENVSFDLGVNDGDLSLSNGAGSLNGGSITGRSSIKTQDGSAFLSSQFLIKDVALDALGNVFGYDIPIKGNVTISGAFDGNGKTPKALIGNLNGSGVVTMNAGTIVGVQTSGFQSLLDQADHEGFEINNETIAPLIQTIFLTDQTQFGDLVAPFSIAKEKLSFRNIAFKRTGQKPKRDIIGSADVSLLTGKVQTSLKIQPDGEGKQYSSGLPEIIFHWSDEIDTRKLTIDTTSIEGFLSIRAFEIEQRRVERLQAAILEKQRYRHEILTSNARARWVQAEIERKEIARLAELEAARLAAEQAAREEAERIAKLEAERLARQKAERIARQKAEQAKALEKARLEKERLEKERLAKEKQEKLRQAKLKQQQEALRKKQLEKATQATEKKQGFEIGTLPAPKQPVKKDIFKNIEDLLFE